MPGANCTSEGLYLCVKGSRFQQCRWGHWSELASLEADTNCDFHGQIGSFASALMPSQALDAPSNQIESLNLAINDLYNRQGQIDLPIQHPVPVLDKSNILRRSEATDVTSSPLYPGNKGVLNLTRRADDQEGPLHSLQARGQRFLVEEPVALDERCKVSFLPTRRSQRQLA